MDCLFVYSFVLFPHIRREAGGWLKDTHAKNITVFFFLPLVEIHGYDNDLAMLTSKKRRMMDEVLLIVTDDSKNTDSTVVACRPLMRGSPPRREKLLEVTVLAGHHGK